MTNNELNSHQHSQQQGRPVIFGEVLFDSFPDGSVVMGGAPLNVACHLKGFGLDPLLISRIGRDELGQQILTTIRAWGLDESGIQQDDKHPTGRVEVTLFNGQPSYAILPEQAYDFIDSAAVDVLTQQNVVALLYHGSLAIRNAVSRTAINTLRNKKYRRFVDINLRAPWYETSNVGEWLDDATWVKLNDDEFVELSQSDISAANVQSYSRQHQIDNMILTLGEHGAQIHTGDNTVSGEPVKVDAIADTVGAGDAFSSIMLLGILSGWNFTETMPRALAFAAFLCTVRGATIKDKTIYRAFKEQWSMI